MALMASTIVRVLNGDFLARGKPQSDPTECTHNSTMNLLPSLFGKSGRYEDQGRDPKICTACRITGQGRYDPARDDWASGEDQRFHYVPYILEDDALEGGLHG